MDKLKFSFTGFTPVILCGKCGAVVKSIEEFDEAEVRALWEINIMPPQHCKICSSNEQ